MSKEKNLVEDAIIQMKNLEEAVAENAKGILASTMKQEIKELVKESIVSEQPDDDEIETEPDDMMGDNTDDDEDFEQPDDESEDDDSDFGDDDEFEDDDSDLGDDEEFELPDDDSDFGDDEVIDLSNDKNISTDDLLRVFKKLGPEDGIYVKKEGGIVNLEDEETDSEYMIRMESDKDRFSDLEEDYTNENYSEFGESFDDLVNQVFNRESSDEDYVYEIETYEDDEDHIGPMDSVKGMEHEPMETIYELEIGEDDSNYENESSLYEIDSNEEYYEDFQMESMKPKIGKGAKIGKPKFSYKKTSGGFKEDMKQGTKGVGMGKGPKKFEFKEGTKHEEEGVMSGGKPSARFHSGKKTETKEASRTYGFGSKSGRGLRKGITPNRNLTFESEQRNDEQVRILREKNEEYRKALNVFRDKLNEVAVFNSNLAYATRLFTEHSTSKQEKINILRRFDGVESLKESKNLYRTIKSELTNTNKTSITESIESKIEKSPSSGSASTLIESKTYENPQFLRMKDIMSKIIK